MKPVTFSEVDALVGEAFLDGHYRPTVVAVVRDRNGRYLVVQSAEDASVWYFPQGGIDEGETFIKALCRELEEEVGIPDRLLAIAGVLGVEDIDAPTDRVDRRGFSRGKRYVAVLARYEGRMPLVIDESEIQGYSWIVPGAFETRIAGVRREKREHMMRLLRAAEVR